MIFTATLLEVKDLVIFIRCHCIKRHVIVIGATIRTVTVLLSFTLCFNVLLDCSFSLTLGYAVPILYSLIPYFIPAVNSWSHFLHTYG